MMLCGCTGDNAEEPRTPGQAREDFEGGTIMIEKVDHLDKRIAGVMKYRRHGAFVIGDTKVRWDSMSICTEVARSVKEELRKHPDVDLIGIVD
jgi:hypothetical protein